MTAAAGRVRLREIQCDVADVRRERTGESPYSFVQVQPGLEAEPTTLEAFRSIDRMREAMTAHFTGGLSPASL